MALTIANGGGGSAAAANIFSPTPTTKNPNSQILLPFSTRRVLHIVCAKKFSARTGTGRLDSKNKRNTVTTKDEDGNQLGIAEIERVGPEESKMGNFGISGGDVGVGSDGYVLPDLPGEKPDFWEGTQWDAFGFVVQYLWAFGIVFALVACGIAVATYNGGASDFKNTPAYKESIESRELLEEPEASNSDVFESNPTEVAPSLE